MTNKEVKKTNQLKGRVLIDNRELSQVSAVEIVPAGNGQYAITLRIVLTSPLEVDPSRFNKQVELKYENFLIPQTACFSADLLDTGIEDRENKVIVSLFFKASRVQSKVTNIQLAR